MKIEGVNIMGTGMMPGAAPDADAVGKSLLDRIRDKQQEIQKLAENKDLSPEDKMKKRQEIQKEIADLNAQLRRHQIEQRREQRQAQKTSAEDVPGGGQQAAGTGSKQGQGTGDKQSVGLSQTAMTAMLSADSSLKQARVQGNVAEQMEGRAGVLKAEIKQDAALGGNTSRKEEELAKIERKAADATASQMNTLGDANRTMKEAAETERENRTENGEKESERTEEPKAGGGRIEEAGNVRAEDAEKSGEEQEETPAQEGPTHVDVRL